MRRHTFLAFVVIALLFPTLVVAQDTEPVGTVSAGDDEVYRAYDNPNVYFNATISILAFGTVHDTEAVASRNVDTTASVVAAAIRSGAEEDGAGGLEFGEVEEVQMGALGDESRADRLPMTMSGSFEGEYVLVTVRQGAWVQVLAGFGFGDGVDVLTDLEAVAQIVLPRWPSDDPIAVREDGLRTGGIWNMMPLPEDLAAEFEVDPESEEGPAATVETVVPAGTPTAGTEAATPTAAPPSPGGRDLPLLPTTTPEDAARESTAVPETPPATDPTPSGPEPTVVPQTPTETPSAASPSPVDPTTINPRIAQPFDVTVEIIIVGERYVIADDGSCSGTGLLDGIAGGGTLTLRESTGGQQSATATLSAGLVGYDTELQQDVCYFRASFSDVPARAQYSLLAGNTVIGRFSYEELTTGDSLVVVLGAE